MTDDQIRIEAMVEMIARICAAENIGWLSKRNQLAYVPDLHQIPLDRNFSETITIHKGKVCRMKMGSGYKHNESFARREYSMINGIEYNRSEWEITNTRQLD